jgi:hypothetical protein
LSWYFAGFNRNKRSLTLNLRHHEGCAVLEKLIAGSDVPVENFRPGVLATMGFGEARLEALNPALVYCNITGFGSSGPYRERPSFDFVAQAMSGFMSVTGEPDGAGLDPVVGEAVHAEQSARLLLGQPERAATSPQCRSDVDLGRLLGPADGDHSVSGMATARTAASLASSNLRRSANGSDDGRRLPARPRRPPRTLHARHRRSAGAGSAAGS